MHFVSDKSLQRPGCTYNDLGVGFPDGCVPWIMWDHIDGPLLHYGGGQLHWLTLLERFRCFLGMEDAESLGTKHLLRSASK